MVKLTDFCEGLIDKYVPENERGELTSALNGFVNTFFAKGFEIPNKNVIQIVDYARELLVKTLATKWEVEFETSDNFNYNIDSIWINLINIELCLRNNISFEDYLEWTDYSNNQFENEEPIINLEHFVKYLKK